MTDLEYEMKHDFSKIFQPFPTIIPNYTWQSSYYSSSRKSDLVPLQNGQIKKENEGKCTV